MLILAGDIGTGPDCAGCLDLFRDLPSRKVLVPGNHDLWVARDATQRDSLLLYEKELPAAAAAAGFHYQDTVPLLFPDEGLALVGSINWYDYSWGRDGLRRLFPEEEHRLLSKRFTRGRHNDANFVRWDLDDEAFTTRVVAAMQRQLDDALTQVDRAIVVVHHPPFQALGFPRDPNVPDLDAFLWDAFCGNRRMEEVLARRADRVALAFCGHTHRACSRQPGRHPGVQRRQRLPLQAAAPGRLAVRHGHGASVRQRRRGAPVGPGRRGQESLTVCSRHGGATPPLPRPCL